MLKLFLEVSADLFLIYWLLRAVYKGFSPEKAEEVKQNPLCPPDISPLVKGGEEIRK
jgi:hypothetical protein